MNNPIETKFVFWPCGHFPYTLGGVAQSRPNGMWYVPTFQMTVKPIAILDPVVGAGILRGLVNLRDQKQRAEYALEQGFKAQALQIAPFIPI